MLDRYTNNSLIDKWKDDAKMYEEVAMRNPEKAKREMDVFEEFKAKKISGDEYHKKLLEIEREYQEN